MDSPVATVEKQELLAEICRHMQRVIVRGAALLDQTHGPNWVDAINLDRLDLLSTCNCVLGQVYGMYHGGVTLLNLSYNAGFYGFNEPCADMTTEEQDLEYSRLVGEFLEGPSYNEASRAFFRVLTDEWRQYILGRRASTDHRN